ncbi:MAG: hypothetical protein NC395_06565 [Prevotella sp.]|nr:hypothetical protein [Prevotella sp.]
MENKFTPELIEKARQAKSAEEILALAKENGISMTDETARAHFERLHNSGEMSDEELDNVSGGGCGWNNKCPACGGMIVCNMYHPWEGGYHNFCNKCHRIYDDWKF